MKVLMINVVCGIRSTGRICTDLAAALETQGHEVKIAYGRETVPEQFQKYAVRIGTDFDVKLHGVKARLFDAAGFGSRKATEKFIEWVKEYNPDVIHLHNIHGYYINVEVLVNYLKTCGKKIIWTLHDCWAFTGHTAYCDAIGCERWENGCYNCPQIKEYPKSLLDRSKQNWLKKKELFTGLNNLTIVTPSYWLARLVKKSFLNEYPTEVIHNGIDTDIFKPLVNDFKEHYGLLGKRVLLGVATAWDNNKGLNDFIELSKRIADHYKVVLVGLSDEQLKTLPQNVIGIKRTSSVKELAQIYTASDVFLNLSYCENYPAVNVEAMACGTPVITYDAGGSPEIVNQCGGRVVPKGNLEILIATIEEVLQSKPELCFNHEENSIETANRQYDKILTNRGGGYWSHKAQYALIGSSVILGVAAIWDARKGLRDMVLLSETLPEDYKMIVVGLTEEQKQGLPNNMIGITRTNSALELSELYSIADVFVNPTYEDNYPTTNIEAIACGTPVITYDTGGSPESAGMYGTSIPKNDMDKLIAAVMEYKHLEAGNVDVDYKSTAKKYVTLYEYAELFGGY